MDNLVLWLCPARRFVGDAQKYLQLRYKLSSEAETLFLLRQYTYEV